MKTPFRRSLSKRPSSPIAWLTSAMLLVVALSLFGLLAAFGLANGVGALGGAFQSRCPSLPEPPSAAAFIQAERDRDVERASLFTSPLFRAELERRGRGAEWPFDGLWLAAASKLDFAYLGAVMDADGFTYTLYKARPKHSDGPNAPTSLWRIDLDPRGRVIWGDFVRLFDSPRVALVHDESVAWQLCTLERMWATPPGGERRQALFGVRSGAGDAYVALHPNPEDAGRIAFAQEDATGQLGPSFWSFGQITPTWGSFDLGGLSDADLRTLDDYLSALDWSPT